MTARVGIVMGSDSDLPVMQQAADMLDALGIKYEMTIVSAHRTPRRMFEYAEQAESRGLRVLIAGAGGAAHLPGMLAALTPLAVIGVPISATKLDGEDALMSIVQMPAGVPVAAVAIDNAINAGLLAAQVLGAGHDDIRARVKAYKQELEASVMSKVERMAAQRSGQ